MSGTAPRSASLAGRLLLGGALVVALMELGSYPLVQARIPADADWEAAAAVVREDYQEDDTLVATPGWNDPTLRLHLGDLLDLSDAGRADLAPFARVWEIALGDAASELLPGRAPDLRERFGELQLRRYDLGPSPIVYDFVDELPRARVELGGRLCPYGRRPLDGGGLWHGPLWPSERHQCEEAAWTFVGETVVEDLELNARRCVWQHPPADNAWVTTTYRDVPLGERIVVHADLYYAHERMREGGPVELRVEVEGREVGRMVHHDGDGWKRMELDPDPLHTGAARGDVSFSVRAAAPHFRTLCWAASSRGPRREVE